MSDADAFLAAIRANPADDTVRLVFADWLDDHGDPALAEFVRVQCELASPHPDPTRAAALARRERELLARYRADWLGDLAGVPGFEAEFARGFVDSITLVGELGRKLSDDIEWYCPVLRHAELVLEPGTGPRTAAAKCLAPVRSLWLSGWPRPSDVAALGASPHLRELEELRLWIGTEADGICQAITAPGAFPGLRRVELVQVDGGLTAGERAAEFDADADTLATEYRRGRPGLTATVVRPFNRPLRFAAEARHGVFAGELRDGRLALAHAGGECRVCTFNADGWFLAAETFRFASPLAPRAVLDFLRERIGFRPAAIHLREFNAPRVEMAASRFDGEYFRDATDPDPNIFTTQSIRHYLRSDGCYLWVNRLRFAVEADGRIAYIRDETDDDDTT